MLQYTEMQSQDIDPPAKTKPRSKKETKKKPKMTKIFDGAKPDSSKKQKKKPKPQKKLRGRGSS